MAMSSSPTDDGDAQGKHGSANPGDAAFSSQRARMVTGQLAARGIRDMRVLEAMGRIPREKFVQEGLISKAYEDRALPIGLSQTISQPYVVALMTEALQLTGKECVLEIGTGSGYQAAILASLASKVFTIDRIGRLSRRARETLDQLEITNIEFRIGDGSDGWPEFAPYDAITVTAAAPDVPKPLIEQLAPGGRLVAPIGERYGQTLIRITKTLSGGLLREKLIPVSFVPLIGKHGWPGDEAGER